MMMKKSFETALKIVVIVLSISGCASTVFPDFPEDADVIIDDGGKVRVEKVNNKRILVADKENAVYEDDNNESDVFVQDQNAVEKVTPAETVKVEVEKLEAVKEKTKIAENTVPTKVEEIEDDKNLITEPAPASNVTTKDEKYVEPVIDDTAPTMHYWAETIYFDNGSAVVDYKYNGELKKIAKVAKDNNAVVNIFGYSSSRTRDTDPVSHKLANFKVSADRADSVAKILQKYGVKPDKINVKALSDSMPAYQEVMPEGERLNRRVEIYLTY